VLGGVKIDGTTVTINEGVISSAGLVTVSATPPAPVQNGALWYDLVGGQLYAWVDDGGSRQWVIAVNQSLGGVYLPMNGGTLTGPLILAGDPVVPLGAATKQYVDTSATQIYAHDNRIINGDMRIDQRNNGAAITSGGYSVDRWILGASVAVAGKFSAQRGQGLSTWGFPFALYWTTTTAYTPVAADVATISQRIEADMIPDFAFGIAAAQPITLSFVVWSSLVGNFGGSIRNFANDRSYPFLYNIPVANAWTKIAVTIPGDTAGTWVNNGPGGAMQVTWDVGSGSTYLAPAGAWSSGNFTGATGQVSLPPINGATFRLTGVKLEIGNVATPFPRQSLAKSMADCQRYFAWANAVVVATGNANVAGSYVYVRYSVSVPMRATPTVVAAWASLNNATAGGIGLFNDARTLQGGLQAVAAGGFSGNLTVTSFSAEL
jgi:hypothetical protein